MSKATTGKKISSINTVLQQGKSHHHGFMGGSLGLLYYYYHAYRISGEESMLARAETLLVNVFDSVNESDQSLNGSVYSNGASGLGYVVNYLQKNKFIDFDIDSEFEELDKYLFESATDLLKKDNIDFLHGSMGVFHYFTSREQTLVVNGYLNRLFEQVYKKAIHTSDGIYFTNLGLERLSKQDVDLSLAHGLTGILLLLIKAWPYLKEKRKVEEIINGGVEYLIKHELPVEFSEQEYSFFPFGLRLDTPEISRINRLAWCYGDLNEVLLFYRAGRLLGNSRYIDIADRIGLKSTERKSPESTISTDSHFCHGNAGLAQIYKCLYNETLNYAYYQAYEYWINETLVLIDKEIEAQKYHTNPVGLLEGWAGVALVLSEYISDEKMEWSDAFLL